MHPRLIVLTEDKVGLILLGILLLELLAIALVNRRNSPVDKEQKRIRLTQLLPELSSEQIAFLIRFEAFSRDALLVFLAISAFCCFLSL